MIPVQRPYLDHRELEKVAEVFESRWLGLGAVTQEFENKLREYLGVKHVIAVNTGTSALHLALAALDLQPSDEVIVPSLTYIASVQAIIVAGARPVFCEVLPDTLNMDLNDVARRITDRTKVIMPVHYGGFACDMDHLLALKSKHKLWIVEDAAHAFGSTFNDQKIGKLGDVTCFSFDPIKNITCGEGGAVVTDNDEIAACIIPKRILGINNDTWSHMSKNRNWEYRVMTPGYRYHLSNINAAIGLCQLELLETFKARKQAIVRRYDEAFAKLNGLSLLDHRNLEESFPFFYVVRVLDKQRDLLMGHLKKNEISTGVHYPPNHTQPLFLDNSDPLPITESVYEEIMTLPLYFEMTDHEIEIVVEQVYSFFNASE